jgi:hypothetical protein
MTAMQCMLQCAPVQAQDGDVDQDGASILNVAMVDFDDPAGMLILSMLYTMILTGYPKKGVRNMCCISADNVRCPGPPCTSFHAQT